MEIPGCFSDVFRKISGAGKGNIGPEQVAVDGQGKRAVHETHQTSGDGQP